MILSCHLASWWACCNLELADRVNGPVANLIINRCFWPENTKESHAFGQVKLCKGGYGYEQLQWHDALAFPFVVH